MPADPPHWRTVYDVADGWHNSGAAGKKHDELRRQCRIAAGRRSEPAAAVIGSQPVKAAEEVSGASCGYDAGKKVNSRKPHIAVDTIGLLLTVLITAAEARIATEQSRYCGTCAVPFPRAKLARADGGYAGELVTWATTTLKPRLTVQIVKRPGDLHAFQVLPRRWVVERPMAWITRYRRTVRDCERLPGHHETIRVLPGVLVKTVGMEFFCYHRDRPGSVRLREELLEEHWSYMDRYQAEMIARGPTLADDGDTPTGSVHILGLPDPAAARAFAFEEPNYQAGVYRDVLLRQWRNLLGRTMWDFPGGQDGGNRYLVLGLGTGPGADLAVPPERDELVAYGPLLSDNGTTWLGTAVLVRAPDPGTARAVLTPDRYADIEVHSWQFGGRPS